MRGLVLRGLCTALAAGRLAAPWVDAEAQTQAAIQQAPAQAQVPQSQVPQGNSNSALRVCADPHSMPQSNDHGEGYENKIAEALARDLGKKVEYTYFPQRMGFVRNTLRARDDQTQQFKCDLIIGVPKGYDITATTKPYMHSIYALVLTPRPDLKDLKSAEDLLKLPPAAPATAAA